MPVAAVTPGGHETVSTGSTIASAGRRCWLRDARLRPEPGEVDDRDRRHLGARARCRRQRDDRKDGPGHRSACADRRVHVVEQVSLVGREERAQLRSVERGATSDPDEAVEASARRRDRLLHGRLAGLADDAVVDDRLDAGGTERGLDPLAEAGTGHEAIADDERPRDSESAGGVTRSAEAPAPKTTRAALKATIVALPSLMADPRE